MNAITPIVLPPGGILPLLAPLNAPRVAQILHYQMASSSVVDAVRQYPQTLGWLYEVLPTLRDQVAQDLAPLAFNDSVSVQTFLSLLRAGALSTNRTDTQLVSNWRGRGLLQTSRYGYLDPQRAAAVLLARRLLPHAIRNWLPNEIVPSEPLWWCWRQDGPTEPITTCPMPLPDDLPPSALVWVPWAGAAWLPDWVPVATGAFFGGGPRTLESVREATRTWNIALEPSTRTQRALVDQPGAEDVPAQQLWVRFATPLVSARFVPMTVQGGR